MNFAVNQIVYSRKYPADEIVAAFAERNIPKIQHTVNNSINAL